MSALQHIHIPLLKVFVHIIMSIGDLLNRRHYTRDQGIFEARLGHANMLENIFQFHDFELRKLKSNEKQKKEKGKVEKSERMENEEGEN